MPPNNGGRGGSKNNGKKSDPLLENLRGACPPHKRKDLDKLFKQMNGDQEKIMEKIQEWWDEPTEQEEVWEDVNKKNTKKKYERERDAAAAARGGRGRSSGRGRGRAERGGGRGSGRGERGEGRGPQPKKDGKDKAPIGEKREHGEEPTPAVEATVPAPVPMASAPALKGAWGARAAAAVTPPAPAAPSPVVQPPKQAVPVKKEEPAPMPATNPLDIGIPSQNDPMPSGRAPELKPVIKSTPVAGGNVWATKGSAHLIRAEKPMPPAAPVAPPASAPVAPIAPAPVAPAPEPEPVLPPAPMPEPSLESGLSTGAWGKSASPTPKAEPAPVPIPAPPAPEPAPPVQVSPQKSAPPPPSPATAPTNVLNMGQWETGDAGDSQQLDFGFGSFGADAEADISKNVASASPVVPKEPNPATTVSPARPPPGLSLGGMPAMPEGAVMVSDLENKMESATLNAPKNDESAPMTSALPQHIPPHANPAPGLPGVGPAPQNFNQYGMPGMYNYNAAGSGFVGMTPAGPVLAGGVVPGQPGKPHDASQLGAGLPQQGLYGAQPHAGPSQVSAPNSNDNSTPGPTPAGIPPGMPGAMPYGNPALAAHYGQHQFYMGQHQGNIGYNYGYGQFGGVQGGFGYQQVMGQNHGYGAPHYDDHSGQNTHQGGGPGGYHKNTGGYRGRNNHHGNNQYQNQYNPQYGGQPYGMGYHGDHFNQRGVYPGGMGDPYGVQQGHTGFQDDEQKGKKGGRGFQQGPPQGFGQSNESTPSTGGWSNNQGGWSGGAPSWQAGNNN